MTSIINVQFAVFPLRSRASQTTSVCPIWNWLPDSLVQVIEALIPELSVAFRSVQTAMAVDWLDTVFIVWFAGHERITGSSTSKLKRQNCGLYNLASYCMCSPKT